MLVFSIGIIASEIEFAIAFYGLQKPYTQAYNRHTHTQCISYLCEPYLNNRHLGLAHTRMNITFYISFVFDCFYPDMILKANLRIWINRQTERVLEIDCTCTLLDFEFRSIKTFYSHTHKREIQQNLNKMSVQNSNSNHSHFFLMAWC